MSQNTLNFVCLINELDRLHWRSQQRLFSMGANLGRIYPPQYPAAPPPPNVFMRHISDDLFFGLHFILSEKSVIWESDDFFFGLHFISGEKLMNFFFGLRFVVGKKSVIWKVITFFFDKKLGICAGVSNHPPQSRKMV